MDKSICGDFPEFCYKGFDCAEHATSFMNEGTLRIGCLPSYRHIEDKDRRDVTEGIARTKEPGDVIVGWVSPNPADKTIWTKECGHPEVHIEYLGRVFCFCTSLPDVDLTDMSKQYEAIVKINDPRRLAEDISDYHADNGHHNVLIRGCRVVYNKGEKRDRKLTDNERTDLAYTQKPRKGFSYQCEFRIVVIKLAEICYEGCKFPSGEFEPKCDFMITLGKQLPYVSLEQ